MSNSTGLGKGSAVVALFSTALVGLGGIASTSNADIAAAFYSTDFGVGLSLGASTNTAWGQTFLSHATGLLQNVNIGYIGGSVQDITLDIWATDGSNPTSLLASRTLHPSDLGGYPNPSNFNFSDDPIWILDGQNYMWSLSVAHADDGQQGIGGVYAGGYTEGALKVSFNGDAGPWYSGYTYSVPFEVTTVVPAPGAVALLGMSGLLIARRRR